MRLCGANGESLGRAKTVNSELVNLIVVHCSATNPSMDIGASEINQWHIDRGWRKIGYHFVIRRSGVLETGRRLNEQGAHVKSHNRNSWGICLVGGVGFDGSLEDNFTAKQWATLRTLLVTLLDIPGLEKRIVGHRDLSPDLDGDGVIREHEWIKGCPSFDVSEKLQIWGLA